MKIQIFCPIYINDIRENILKALKYFLNRLLRNIDSKVESVSIINNRFIEAELIGSEREIGANYLQKLLGKPINLEELKINFEYVGRIVSVDENFVIIDIGLEPQKYVKILTHVFLTNLLNLRKRIPNPLTLWNYIGIDRYYPISVEIKKIDNGELWGLPSRRFKIIFRRMLEMRLDRVYVWGVLRSHIDKVLRKSGLYKKIIKVERLGLLEHNIICKFGVFADRFAKELRKLGIQNTSVLMPRKLKKMINKLG